MATKSIPSISDQESKAIPQVDANTNDTPEVTNTKKAIPKVSSEKKEIPSTMNAENVVTINGEAFEIKPTKLKYQRDRTAAFYRILDVYPLPDILAMDEGVLDPKRDGDKCLFDWLIAVFDDPKTVVKNYDAMDSAVVDRLLKIFKRLNNIDEKEEQAKNRETKGMKR